MTPLKQYQQDLQNPEFQADATQAYAVEQLEFLYQQLTKKKSLLNFFSAKEAVKGLYLYGTVGAGKTYLMDTFYACLPFKDKLRQHFHVFMRDVHEQLKTLQGEIDPLKKLAEQLRSRTRIICFDEFIVQDIADAMILGRLFTNLFAQGLVLVATSNVKLDNLYLDGLQRDRFLPTIDLLKAKLIEIQVGQAIDYRLQESANAETYFYPLNVATQEKMQASFEHYAHLHSYSSSALNVNQRDFNALAVGENVVWFEFSVLCEQACGANDYLAIAKQFNTLLISHIPLLNDDNLNAVLRFVKLIDIVYDEEIRCIISAATSCDKLYQGKAAAFEFERTASRLFEMQTTEYLEKSVAKKYLSSQQL